MFESPESFTFRTVHRALELEMRRPWGRLQASRRNFIDAGWIGSHGQRFNRFGAAIDRFDARRCTLVKARNIRYGGVISAAAPVSIACDQACPRRDETLCCDAPLA
jgi:hypothetical protein